MTTATHIDRSATVGVLIVAHGTLDEPRASLPCRRLAQRLHASRRFARVEAAFLKEPPSVSAALEALTTDEVIVVPWFMAEGWFTTHVLPRELELAQPPSGRRVLLTPPLGVSPLMPTIVRAMATERLGERAAEGAVLVVGHGTGRTTTSGQSLHRVVEKLRGLGVFAEVEAAFLEQAPRIEEAMARLERPDVVVVPWFAAEGPHSAVDLPAALGIPHALAHAPHHRGHRRIQVTPPVGTVPALEAAVIGLIEATLGG